MDPQIDAIKPKQPSAPDFSKQKGREQEKKLDDDEVYVLDLPEDPIPNDPGQPRVKGAHNFAIGKDRFNNDKEMAREMGYEDDEVYIENTDAPKRIKGFVDMGKHAEERFKEKLNEDPFYDD